MVAAERAEGEEREIRVILTHLDIAGGHKDRDGFDESGVVCVAVLG